MATNPMKRKSKISFLMGVLVTLIFAALAIAFLLIQLKIKREQTCPVQIPCLRERILSR